MMKKNGVLGVIAFAVLLWTDCYIWYKAGKLQGEAEAYETMTAQLYQIRNNFLAKQMKKEDSTEDDTHQEV